MKKIRIAGSVLFILVTVILFNYCDTTGKRPDVQILKEPLRVYRFDKELFTLDTTHLLDQAAELHERYPQFFNLYTEGIIQIGAITEREFSSNLSFFLTDPTQRDAYQDVQKVYGDFKVQEEELRQAFSYLLYYFPDYVIPDFYLFVGAFNQSIVADSGIMGIALEKYLYSDYFRYIELGIPTFIRQKMDQKQLVSDCMRAIAQIEFPFESETDNLVQNMIWEGRVLYFIQAMMPDINESLVIQYDEAQLEYCYQHERHIWEYLVDQKYLFETDYKVFRRYLSDGPFTPGFPDSPARTGIFTGWQIVKAYMKQNPTVSLSELMNEKDYQKILNLSRYNP